MLHGFAGIVVQWVTYFAIYGIIALSFNIEYGFTGIPNFGKVLFVAIGAYAAGVLAASLVIDAAAPLLHVKINATGMPQYCSGNASYVLGEAGSVLSPWFLAGVFLLAVLAAAVAGAVSSVVASFPALRLREDFLAITLLAAGEIVRLVTWTSTWPVCGFNGINGIPGPFAWSGSSDLLYMLVALGFLVLAYLYTDYATNSPWGRALKAVRDDEVAAEVYGYDIARIRMQALLVGSALAGVAGALLVFYSGNVNANSYKPDLTFMVIAAVILGGSANNLGALVGAAIITSLDIFMNPSAFQALGITLPTNVGNALVYLKYVILGLVILAVLAFRPQGLLPEGPLRTPIVEKTRKRLQQYLSRIAGSSAAGTEEAENP